MKILKKIGIVLICIPAVLLFLFIGYELFGIVINNIYGQIHTDDMLMALSNNSDIVVLDTYTFVGNSSGTGNHCDLLTAAVVRNDIGDIYSFYYATDKCADHIFSLSELQEYDYEKWSSLLDFPEDETDCYLLIKIDSAPFKDNIQGH